MRSGIPDRYGEVRSENGRHVRRRERTRAAVLHGLLCIGISRTLAAIVEQHHDEHGIVWPVSVAPYEVSVIALDKKGEAFEEAARIAEELASEGIDVVFDDRNERPGVKFADNDLMGFPYQVIVGKRGLANGTVEVKDRATGDREDIARESLMSTIAQRVRAARA